MLVASIAVIIQKSDTLGFGMLRWRSVADSIKW